MLKPFRVTVTLDAPATARVSGQALLALSVQRITMRLKTAVSVLPVTNSTRCATNPALTQQIATDTQRTCRGLQRLGVTAHATIPGAVQHVTLVLLSLTRMLTAERASVARRDIRAASVRVLFPSTALTMPFSRTVRPALAATARAPTPGREHLATNAMRCTIKQRARSVTQTTEVCIRIVCQYAQLLQTAITVPRQRMAFVETAVVLVSINGVDQRAQCVQSNTAPPPIVLIAPAATTAIRIVPRRVRSKIAVVTRQR